MRSIEVSGKSVDEAIFNGLKQLEISIDEVKIDIIQQETKGFIGIGAKPAKVRLTEKEQEKISIPEYMREDSAPRRDPRFQDNKRNDSKNNARNSFSSKAKENVSVVNTTSACDEECDAVKPENVSASIEQPITRVREANSRRQNDQRNRNNGGERIAKEREERAVSNKPQIDYSEDAAKDNSAAIFLKGLLEKMNIEGNVLANIDGDNVRLRIDSQTMGILIGHRGETLDALQYLTSLAVNRSRKDEGYIRVTIDTEGYRDKREETLVRLARKVASQVKASGRSKALEPMNPYERRVLHSTLQNNPYVTTYSEGEEPNRRVIVALKDRRQSRGYNNDRRTRQFVKKTEEAVTDENKDVE